MRKVTLATGVECWDFGLSQYVQEAVKNIQKYLDDLRTVGNTKYSFPVKANTPMQTSYRCELDVTPELDDKYANYFQSLIGVLRWIV